MIRIKDMKEFKGTKIESFGKKMSLEPLNENEYKELYEILKSIDPAGGPINFHESQLIVGKLPDNLSINEIVGDSGDVAYSIPLILNDNRWSSFIVTDANVKETIESHPGATVAIVGRLVTKQKDDKEYLNIKYIRGIVLLTETKDPKNKGGRL